MGTYAGTASLPQYPLWLPQSLLQQGEAGAGAAVPWGYPGGGPLQLPAGYAPWYPPQGGFFHGLGAWQGTPSGSLAAPSAVAPTAGCHGGNPDLRG